MAMVLSASVMRLTEDIADLAKSKKFEALGVEDEIKKLQRIIEKLRGLLQNAERLMHQDKEINSWVRQLKEVIYDADDVLDFCDIEGSKLLEKRPSISSVRSSSNLLACFTCAKFRHEIADRIETINNRLKEIVENRSVVSRLEPSSHIVMVQNVNFHDPSPLSIKPEIVGTQIVESAQSLVRSILLEDERKCAIFGIVGNPGIGKSTLARRVFDDERIIENFPVRVWASITKKFSPTELLRNIIKSAKVSSGQATTREELENDLLAAFSKRFFLVLDDVWSSNVWEDLLKISTERGSASGRILITCQSKNAVKNMGATISHIEELNAADGWKLLWKNVFPHGKEESLPLKEIGVQIVEKCEGLPLAIKVIAGVLQSKNATTTEWTRVLESQHWSISQIDKEVPKALYLSYEDLPADLKQCFLYCSLYKAGSKIFRQDIIRYWLAEGFVKRPTSGSMEDAAENYYKSLIRRNLLEPDPHSSEGSICTLHGLMHAFGRSLGTNESISLGNGAVWNADLSVVIHRLSVNNMVDEAIELSSVRQPTRLRTLLFRDSPQPQVLIANLIRRLSSVRVLELSDTSLVSVPDSLGNLIHLRYLNLARTRISELPGSIGNLRNLQSLILDGCKSLLVIPNEVTKLSRLQCLQLKKTSLSHVPKGISKLKVLNHLTGFILGNQGDELEGCNLEELQSLMELRGLEIHGLEKAVRTASVLADKNFLRTLVLSSSATINSEGNQLLNKEIILTIENIYNELCPPPSLQQLTIINFCGTVFPRWLTSSTLAISFPNLAELRISDSHLCLDLPPLGQLPQLSKLFISGANGVSKIGQEFLQTSGELAEIVFPKLEYLHLERMDNLEEWSLIDKPDDEGEFQHEHASTKVMPYLKELFLDHCPKLRAVPKGLHLLTGLRSLIIQHADSLVEVSNLPSVERLLLQHNSSLKKVSHLSALKWLKVDSCLSLESVESLEALEQLQVIYPTTTNSSESPDISHDEANGIDEEAKPLPNWLPGIVRQQKRTLKALYLTCDLTLLKQCAPKGRYWDLMFQIHELHAQTPDRETYLSVTMVSHASISYQTNSALLMPPE